jgi:hypothetical protein
LIFIGQTQWHDFFVMVGDGAAALTGLVFVALSLNLAVIAQDATHRYRAIVTPAGFTAAFILCALVLMGNQNHLTVGVEWLVISTIAAAMYVYGYIQALKLGRSSAGLHLNRLVGATAYYIAEILGAILLILGYIAGLYVAAIALTILLAVLISGAWLLIVGVYRDEGNQHTGKAENK